MTLIVITQGYLDYNPRIVESISDGKKVINDYCKQLEIFLKEKTVNRLESYVNLISELKPYSKDWRMKNELNKVMEILKKHTRGGCNLLILLNTLGLISQILNTKIILYNDSKTEISYHFGYDTKQYSQFTFDVYEVIDMVKFTICKHACLNDN